MLFMSIGGLLLGPVVNDMHLSDWWHPKFVFNSTIKIEDLLFGFVITGIISAVYSIISNRNSYNIENVSLQSISRLKIAITVLTALSVLTSSYYIFHLHSFWASVMSMLSVIFLFAYFNNGQKILKPFTEMILTGFIIVSIALPGYLLGINMNPDWIHQDYFLANLSQVYFLSLPIEELMWFFLASISISAFYLLLASLLRNNVES